jgi:hypothetical protein
MDEHLKVHLAQLEGRARRATGLCLGLSGFACSYALELLYGRGSEPASLLFPCLAGACLYLGGELLGLVWFRVVSLQLLILQARREAPAKATEGGMSENTEKRGDGVHLELHEPLQEIEVVQAG